MLQFSLMYLFLYLVFLSRFPITRTSLNQYIERPRFFSIYVSEARNCIKLREKHDHDKVISNNVDSSLSLDLNLYGAQSEQFEHNHSVFLNDLENSKKSMEHIDNICDAFDMLELRNSDSDIYSNEQTNNNLTRSLPPMTKMTKNLVQKRISELVNKAYSDNRIVSLMTKRDKCHLMKLIELRSVRELGISDLYAIELHNSSCKLKKVVRLGRCSKRLKKCTLNY